MERHIKVCLDFEDCLVELGDAEKGRLFAAMLRYARCGELPELRGGERVIWQVAKAKIDRDNADYARLCERNKRNRLASTSRDQSSPLVTSRHHSSPVVTSGHQSSPVEKKEKNQKKENPRRSITPLSGFENFWNEYPKKVSKQEAIKAFNKLEPDTTLLDTILEALRTQKRSSDWTRDNGQYIPHPATWLNQRRWEDEGTQIEPQEEDRYANLRRLYAMYAEEESR